MSAHHQKESNTTNLDLPKAVITPKQEKSIIKIEAVNEFWRSALMFGDIRWAMSYWMYVWPWRFTF